MNAIALHHPHGHDLDRFLYAPVGEDRNGNAVTLLSALARLGFDPWQEASELGALSSEAARVRLGATLSKFKDVPALLVDHGSIAQHLTEFLPEHSKPDAPRQAGQTASHQPSISVATIFAIAMTLLLIVRLFLPDASG